MTESTYEMAHKEPFEFVLLIIEWYVFVVIHKLFHWVSKLCYAEGFFYILINWVPYFSSSKSYVSFIM